MGNILLLENRYEYYFDTRDLCLLHEGQRADEESPSLLMEVFSGALSTMLNMITTSAAKSLTRRADSFFLIHLFDFFLLNCRDRKSVV